MLILKKDQIALSAPKPTLPSSLCGPRSGSHNAMLKKDCGNTRPAVCLHAIPAASYHFCYLFIGYKKVLRLGVVNG